MRKLLALSVIGLLIVSLFSLSALGATPATEWSVWVCDHGQPRNVLQDPQEVVEGWESVTEYFNAESNGNYAPTMVVGGIVEGADYHDCDRKVGGPAVIIFHVPKFENSGVFTVRPNRIVFGQYSRWVPAGPNVIGHELGHTLGWTHVPVIGTSHGYTNYTNLMSQGDTVAAPHKEMMGWIEAETHNGANGYDLSTTEMVKVPFDGFYWALSSGPHGVEMHRVDDSGVEALSPEGATPGPIGWSEGAVTLGNESIGAVEVEVISPTQVEVSDFVAPTTTTTEPTTTTTTTPPTTTTVPTPTTTTTTAPATTTTTMLKPELVGPVCVEIDRGFLCKLPTLVWLIVE